MELTDQNDGYMLACCILWNADDYGDGDNDYMLMIMMIVIMTTMSIMVVC